MDNQKKLKLLYARAGFSVPPATLAENISTQSAVERLFPSADPVAINVISQQEYDEYRENIKASAGDKEKTQELIKNFRRGTAEVNKAWLAEMVATSHPLREKMALFWHGHFATRIGNPWFDQLLLHTIRKNALGNFGTLLTEVSKSAAMLLFLNNRQNRKEHPNENFAREVMELFTLGRGKYTENDIKEAARAFTGWAFDKTGNFVFRERWHDTGLKTIFGKTGAWKGDDVLDMILSKKETARFISAKLYRFFVSDTETDDEAINWLANRFYNNKYDITLLLKDLFTADWFYGKKIPGNKIKSPIELLVAYQKLIPCTFDNERAPIALQRILGQTLFEPPNVAGWPGGKSWIDSSSLIVRMSLPKALFGDKELDLTEKTPEPEGIQEAYARRNDTEPYKRRLRATPNWDGYLSYWKGIPDDELPGAIGAYLLPLEPGKESLKQVQAFADRSTTERYIKSLTILFMSLPEYQLT